MSTTYILLALRRQVIDRAKERCKPCHYQAMFTFAPHEVNHIIAGNGGATVLETKEYHLDSVISS